MIKIGCETVAELATEFEREYRRRLADGDTEEQAIRSLATENVITPTAVRAALAAANRSAGRK